MMWNQSRFTIPAASRGGRGGRWAAGRLGEGSP
ncbi:hypothetical protein SFR_0930 [Streptomyces sp. FR-008]|nr:hypothetical protein SFR_0930 [Streptomyces sp. FR-008]